MNEEDLLPAFFGSSLHKGFTKYWYSTGIDSLDDDYHSLLSYLPPSSDSETTAVEQRLSR